MGGIWMSNSTFDMLLKRIYLAGIIDRSEDRESLVDALMRIHGVDPRAAEEVCDIVIDCKQKKMMEDRGRNGFNGIVPILERMCDDIEQVLQELEAKPRPEKIKSCRSDFLRNKNRNIRMKNNRNNNLLRHRRVQNRR